MQSNLLQIKNIHLPPLLRKRTAQVETFNIRKYQFLLFKILEILNGQITHKTYYWNIQSGHVKTMDKYWQFQLKLTNWIFTNLKISAKLISNCSSKIWFLFQTFLRVSNFCHLTFLLSCFVIQMRFVLFEMPRIFKKENLRMSGKSRI